MLEHSPPTTHTLEHSPPTTHMLEHSPPTAVTSSALSEHAAPVADRTLSPALGATPLFPVLPWVLGAAKEADGELSASRRWCGVETFQCRGGL